MDARDIEKLVMKAKDDIIKEVHDKLPRKVGVVAVNHFKQNFRDGGWLDNGLHPWKRTRRQEGTGTNASRGPLLSGREHLMKSIQASTSPQRTVDRSLSRLTGHFTILFFPVVTTTPGFMSLATFVPESEYSR